MFTGVAGSVNARAAMIPNNVIMVSVPMQGDLLDQKASKQRHTADGASRRR